MTGIRSIFAIASVLLLAACAAAPVTDEPVGEPIARVGDIEVFGVRAVGYRGTAADLGLAESDWSEWRSRASRALLDVFMKNNPVVKARNGSERMIENFETHELFHDTTQDEPKQRPDLPAASPGVSLTASNCWRLPQGVFAFVDVMVTAIDKETGAIEAKLTITECSQSEVLHTSTLRAAPGLSGKAGLTAGRFIGSHEQLAAEIRRNLIASRR